ncbi:hypothetical protein OC834_005497 [Tilletia horrida]|nr:hypothetical protein OC834_005497 [Tilletia horrida]
MPRSIADLRAANVRAATALTTSNPSFVPLAVLLGGTSGIGLATAYALSTAFRGKIHLVLSSRSASKAADVIRGLPFPPTEENGGSVEFASVDATSMRSVRELGAQVREKAEAKTGGKVNYLVLSCGQLVLQGSDRTEEGIERKLAMNYYARWALAELLRPQLEAARAASQPARVISILAPGRGGPIDTSDFGLHKEAERSGKSVLKLGQWLRKAEEAGVTYNDWAAEHYAARSSGLSVFHSYPGIVKTDVMSNMPLPVRVLSAPLFYLGISAEESGEEHASFLLGEDFKEGGAFFRGPRGKEIPPTHIKGLEGEARQKKIEELWEHTLQVTGIGA